MGKSPDAHYVSIDQLDVGMYVYLDLSWMDHDFPLNSFKIKNERQIEQIDPARSENWPPVAAEDSAADDLDEDQDGAANVDQLDLAQQEFIRQQRAALAECERQFTKAAASLRAINANVHARPQEAFVAAAELVQNLMNTILSNKDVAIRLMNDKAGGEEMYYHALNVSVLAMMLAKELGVLPSDIEQLGLGCLFHDIGKTLIPYRVLKADKPTRAEMNLLQQHCAYGVTIGAKVSLSKEATEVVMQHHERFDGSGYPNNLKGDEISRLTRIASIVNVYDNHCNPPNPADALTPYEALAFMYAHERKWFDSNFLSVFIKSMGVYPPGTLVRLTDERLGMVIAANFGAPLRPRVLIYDPAVPKNDATVLDLQMRQDLSIEDSLRPADLTRAVYDYLSPRTRMTYFFEPAVRPPR
jgi:putative nucleotidyltransferase with HDIG domain